MNTTRPTKMMQNCIDYAKKHDGKLYRHPGGFWSHTGWRSREGDYFGTNTVNGLVLRGLAEYSDWKEGRSGRFPIEITLINTPTGER